MSIKSRFFKLVVVVIVVTTIVSCKKETEKAPLLVGDWNMSTYKITGVVDRSSQYTDYSGSQNVNKSVVRDIKTDNNTILAVYSDSIFPIGQVPTNTPRQYQTVIDSGAVEANTISFSKDGTWVRNFSFTMGRTGFYTFIHHYTGIDPNGLGTFETRKLFWRTRYKIRSSGKWTLINNNSGVSLTILTEQRTNIALTDQQTADDSNITYADGSNVQTWKLSELQYGKLSFEVIGSYRGKFENDSATFTQESGVYVR